MIEYRVKPVVRFIVTRFEAEDRACGSSQRGEYDNQDVAYEVAYALCKMEHEAAGAPLDSMEFIYPEKDAWRITVEPNNPFEVRGNSVIYRGDASGVREIDA